MPEITEIPPVEATGSAGPVERRVLAGIGLTICAFVGFLVVYGMTHRHHGAAAPAPPTDPAYYANGLALRFLPKWATDKRTGIVRNNTWVSCGHFTDYYRSAGYPADHQVWSCKLGSGGRVVHGTVVVHWRTK